jgi:hypothetical protein
MWVVPAEIWLYFSEGDYNSLLGRIGVSFFSSQSRIGHHNQNIGNQIQQNVYHAKNHSHCLNQRDITVGH